MQNYISDKSGVIAQIPPQTVTAGATVTSDVIDMKNIHQVLFTFQLGAWAADGGTLVAKVTGDTDSGGSFATDITGKSLTPANFNGDANDEDIGRINVRDDEVAEQSLRYIRLEVTPTSQDLTCSALAEAEFNYLPAENLDLAKVVEIVT